jgi:phenylacetate-CoA ligase
MKILKHEHYLAGQDSLEKTRAVLANDHYFINLSREEIEKLQESRLREMLIYAKKKSLWYRERLKHIDAPHFKLADLAQIPIMNKRDLMDNWDQIVTDKVLTLNEAGPFLFMEKDYSLFHGYHLFASGGSSGRRGMYVWDTNEIAITVAGLHRYQYRDGFQCSNGGEGFRVASIAALKPVHLSETVFAFPALPLMKSLALSALAPIDDIVTALNDYQPTHLNGYPSVISRLANHAIKGDLKISPKRILVGAEPLMDSMLRLIKKAWKNVVLTNQWGSTDAGAHASACDYSNGQLHLNEDLVIVEPVDDNNTPVLSGETSTKILITNLYRKSMPIFRYEMDDMVCMVADKCACGSNYQLIHSIEGRHEDDFIYNNIIVMAEMFENSIMPEPGVDEYQVFQTPNGANILIVPVRSISIDAKKMQHHLAAELESAGLRDPEVNVKLVDQLERHPETCKLKRFNSLENQKNKSSRSDRI